MPLAAGHNIPSSVARSLCWRARWLINSQLLTIFYLRLTRLDTNRRILSFAFEGFLRGVRVQMKRKKILGGFNRFRLMLTLGLAVLLPAAALIFVNFLQ